MELFMPLHQDEGVATFTNLPRSRQGGSDNGMRPTIRNSSEAPALLNHGGQDGQKNSESF